MRLITSSFSCLGDEKKKTTWRKQLKSETRSRSTWSHCSIYTQFALLFKVKNQSNAIFFIVLSSDEVHALFFSLATARFSGHKIKSFFPLRCLIVVAFICACYDLELFLLSFRHSFAKARFLKIISNEKPQLKSGFFF